METRAPFILVGAFILAAIVAVFGFVYWLHNTGGLGARVSYQVNFNGPVPGLAVRRVCWGESSESPLTMRARMRT